MPSPVLEVQNLGVSFHTHEGIVRAVNGLNYKVYPRETLGIVGESGSGKSVSSMAVMGLLPPQVTRIAERSSVKILGKEVLNLSKKELTKYRGNVMSMIFQDPMTCLNPYRRVDTQMIEALCFHKNESKKNALKKAQEMLEYVHIPEAKTRLNSYPHELSGGMRQRVMIAMALMTDPKLIFADEPTTALDVTVQAQIMSLFSDIQKRFNTAIVLISHDLGLISTQCQRIMVMYAGQMMETGSPQNIFENPRHPYTLALRKSIPDLHPTTEESGGLYTIEGNPPNLMHLPVGCPFSPRCTYAQEDCEKNPSMREIDATTQHRIRCHRDDLEPTPQGTSL